MARVIGIFLTKDRAQRILKQRLATLQNVLEETSGKVRGSSKGAFDALTNLLTAGAFQEQTEQYIETGPAPYTTALFILDMDDFKRINAVSYTHLDVYKRQPETHLCGGGRKGTHSWPLFFRFRKIP